MSKVVPTFKKRDHNDCNNYRGVRLLNMSYKLYAFFVAKPLNVIVETILQEAQHGFRKGKYIIDCIFTIAQVIKKAQNIQLPTYLSSTVERHLIERIGAGCGQNGKERAQTAPRLSHTKFLRRKQNLN